MSTVVGGLRARLVSDSLVAHVTGGLTELGWFDSNRRHAPLVVINRPPGWDEPIEVNTMSIRTERVYGEDIEVGSDLTGDTISAAVEFFAQNDSLGVDVSTDVRDVLRGRVGHGSTPTFPIYDFRTATPTPIGYVVVDQIEVSHQVTPTLAAWMRSWYVISLTLQDNYLPGEGVLHAYPSNDLYPSFDLFPGS